MVAALPSPPIAAACENSFESNTMSYLIELQTDTGVKKKCRGMPKCNSAVSNKL